MYPDGNRIIKPKICVFICFILFVRIDTCLAKNPSHENLESYNLVWQTVQSKHFDSSFGGLDWNAMYGRYRPQIALSGGIEEFNRITNQMLFRLGLSHFLVATEGMLKTYMPTLFSGGTTGLELRWINNMAVVTKSKPGSPGYNLGIRPGHVITGIDGREVNDIVRNAQVLPPYNMRNFRGGISNYLTGCINGPSNTSVVITHLDENSQINQSRIVRRSRGSGKTISDAFPPIFVEFEAHRLKRNIGYIWFNHFAAPVDKKFSKALETMKDTSGLIVDVRGNPGGYFRILDAIIASLITEKMPLYRFQFRDNAIERTLIPCEHPYTKPVVVLVDVTTTSAGELFAACLQAIGRAVIVGERSPGYLLVANWMKLPNGLSFMYAFGQAIPIDGRVIEGNGVAPDIEIELKRSGLLMGIDNPLEAAVAHIMGKSEQ